MLSTTLQYLKARYDLDSSEGATAVEYGIMVALIAVVIIAAVVILGDGLADLFSSVGDRIQTEADTIE